MALLQALLAAPGPQQALDERARARRPGVNRVQPSGSPFDGGRDGSTASESVVSAIVVRTVAGVVSIVVAAIASLVALVARMR